MNLINLTLLIVGVLYAAPDDRLVKFAQSIAVAEGFYDRGSLSFRRNNPGSLTNKWGDLIQFKSPEAGWVALGGQLERASCNQSRYYKPTMSLASMSRVWARNSEDWLRNVLSSLRRKGIPASPSTTIRGILGPCQGRPS